MSIKTTIKKSLAVLFLLSFAAIPMPRVPADAADAAAQLAAKLYEGAKKEGKLVIYGLGEPFLTPIASAFKRRYAGITIEALDEPGAQSLERVIAEQKTSRPIGDIIIAGPINTWPLTDLNYLEPFKTSQWAEMIPELLPDIPNANPPRAKASKPANPKPISPESSCYP